MKGNVDKLTRVWNAGTYLAAKKPNRYRIVGERLTGFQIHERVMTRDNYGMSFPFWRTMLDSHLISKERIKVNEK